MLSECFTTFLRCPGKLAGSRIEDQALKHGAFIFYFQIDKAKFNIVTDALLINQKQHLEILLGIIV